MLRCLAINIASGQRLAILRATMEMSTLAVYLLAAFVGSYVQSVTGFAMGMIIIAVTVGGGLVEVPIITAVISIISLVNILLALRGRSHHLQVRMVVWLSVGLVPATGVGVLVLEVLDSHSRWLLELLLGLFIVVGSLSMMLRPIPRTRISAPWACVTAGLAGGLLGGMFAASGPVIGWFNYRQPLSVAEIRATLLACFALTTTLRSMVVGFSGGLTEEVWLLAGMALPLVLLGTWAGRRFAPPLAEDALKRCAFGLLLLMGCWTVFRAAVSVG